MLLSFFSLADGRQDIDLSLQRRLVCFRPAQALDHFKLEACPLTDQSQVVRGNSHMLAIFINELKGDEAGIYTQADHLVFFQESKLVIGPLNIVVPGRTGKGCRGCQQCQEEDEGEKQLLHDHSPS